MPRLISVDYDREIRVTINLLELERLAPRRSAEIADQLVEAVKRECFKNLGLTPSVDRSLLYISLSAPSPPTRLGYVERAAEAVERTLRSKLMHGTHYATLFSSKNKLEPFNAAIYTLETAVPESVRFNVLWELARIVRKASGLEAAPLGRNAIAMPSYEGVKMPKTLKAETSVGLVETVYAGNVKITPRKHTRFLKNLVHEAVREKARLAGLQVDRETAFYDYSILESGEVAVRRGYHFAAQIMPDGYVLLSVTPRLSVEAVKPLTPETAAPGLTVRRLSDGLSGKIISVSGSLCRARIGGLTEEVELEELVPIFTMKELARLGLARKVIAESRKMHARWNFYARKFVETVGSIEIASQKIEFSPDPAPLGV